MPAFDDDEKNDNEFIPKRKIGIKQANNHTNHTNHTNDKKDNIISSSNFENKAKEAFDKSEELKHKIWDLSSKFKKMLDNNILAENKTHLQISSEKEIIDELVKLAIDMNQDENQPEGIGSIMLSTLLIKIVISQRDIINKLSYDLHMQKKQNVSSG